MSDQALVVVAIGNGLAVWHTREEWDAFMRGLDREAIEAMTADLDERRLPESA
jgi:flagellar biosynthesis/type III secretory pathway M-ring protein FliF/YscJ